MVNTGTILFVLLGICLIWFGINGTLGTALACLFAPNSVILLDGGGN